MSIKQILCNGAELIVVGNAHEVPAGVLALDDIVQYRWLCQKRLRYWGSEDPDCFYGFSSIPPAVSLTFECLQQGI